MDKITVYEKPTCTTCRKTVKLLNEKGINFDRINYYIEPLSKNKIKTLLKKCGLEPEEIIRKKEKIYKDLDLKNKKLNKSELIELLAKYPDLIQRPIVEKGERAVLARPVEKINELFD